VQRASRLLLVCSVIALIPVCSAGSGQVPFHLSTYGNPTPLGGGTSWSLSDLAELGFDGFYTPADWTLELSHPGWFEEVVGKESLKAAELGMTYVVGERYICPIWNYIDMNYSRWASKSGIIEPYVPSCVDERWWRHIFEEPGVFLANLSLYYPIWGIVWDMEISGYTPNLPEEYTYDIAALRSFGRDSGIEIPQLQPDEGYIWLQRNGLLKQYQRWMDEKVYWLAKKVEEEIHTINPNLSLGLLYFDVPPITPNYYWKILEAFNSSQAPVTAWGEDTYGGYILGGPKGVDTFRRLFREHKLNGMFLPGIAYPGPPSWRQLIALEEAYRDNGHLWLFQHLYDRKRDQEYKMNFRFLRSYLLFNRTEPNPLPSFHIYPAVEAMPYLGPDNETSSALFKRYPYGTLDPNWNFTLITDSTDLLYVGHNYTVKPLSEPNPVLKLSDLPCIVYGMKKDDMLPTEVMSLIEEMNWLLKAYKQLHLDDGGLHGVLEQARRDFDQGRYQSAQRTLLDVRDNAYLKAVESLWPRVQAGLANPRKSEIPISVLRHFVNAKELFDRGQFREGEISFIEGASRWIEVEEGRPWTALAALSIVVLVVARAPARLTDRADGSSKPTLTERE